MIQTNRLVSANVQIIIGKTFCDSLFGDNNSITAYMLNSARALILTWQTVRIIRTTYNKQQELSRIYLIETKTFSFNAKIYVSNFLFVLFKKRVRAVHQDQSTYLPFPLLWDYDDRLPSCQNASERVNMVPIFQWNLIFCFVFISSRQQHKRGWFSFDSARNTPNKTNLNFGKKKHRNTLTW